MLNQNGACPVEGGFGVGNAFCSIDIGGGCLQRVLLGVGQQQGGQGCQTGFAGNLGFGAAFGLIGQVEVFQRGFVAGGVERGFEFGGEFVLLADAAEDGVAAVV